MQTPIILYDNRFLDGAITATNTAPGYDVNNIKDLRPYTWWAAVGLVAQYITVDCGSVKSANCIAMIGHNLSAAAGGVVVQSSLDNITWSTMLAAFVPASDKAFLKKLVPSPDPAAPCTGRYWRIVIVAPTVAPHIAVVFLGTMMQFEYPPDAPYVPYTETPVADVERSKNGHILGVSTYLPALQLQPQFSNINRTWLDAYLIPFWQTHARLLKPFFFAWDLDTYPADVFFVSIDDESALETPFSLLSLVDSITLKMRGVREI